MDTEDEANSSPSKLREEMAEMTPHSPSGCFAVRSEGGPGLISLQWPARLLISPKPLAFLALNSGATLSFAKL